MIRAVVLAALLTLPQVTRADETRADLLDFLSHQGCTIGPTTRQAAVKAGFTDAGLDALADEARAKGQAEQQRDWLVLSPGFCTIRPPQIASALRLDDPDVRKHFMARDAMAADGYLGCFFDTEAMRSEVKARRGWDDDTTTNEYIRLVGASLISGEMTFYSDTPLATPVGFALLTGDCAELPDIQAIRQDHAVLIEQFDPLVRVLGQATICEDGGMPAVFEAEAALAAIPGDKSKNAWQWFEVVLIAMGAGWYEGMGATDIGTPRPPFCHYE